MDMDAVKELLPSTALFIFIFFLFWLVTYGVEECKVPESVFQDYMQTRCQAMMEATCRLLVLGFAQFTSRGGCKGLNKTNGFGDMQVWVADTAGFTVLCKPKFSAPFSQGLCPRCGFDKFLLMKR